MNYYERNINSFLSSVTSNMSAVYLPAFFVSLIQLLDDFFKFAAIPDGDHILVRKTTVVISYQLVTAYFLSYLLKIRNQIPTIRMSSTKGRTHDQRFLEEPESIESLDSPAQIMNSRIFTKRHKRAIYDMMDSQNILPIFEKRCPVL